jgi:hypothetical protein
MGAKLGEPQRVAWSAGQRSQGAAGLRCVRCGYPVPDLVMGCKAPCRNCRFIYPIGDCSD